MTDSKEQYDYIVVGAGSAGCVAAYRLAEQSDAQVLLIESGGKARSPLVHIPIGFAALIGQGRHNWNYQTEPESNLAQRQINLARGRMLGGCSAINGMVYIRGQREDYDDWAALGNVGWSYDDMLPLFKRSESHWGGANEYHGGDGLHAVSKVASTLPVSDAFIAAAAQAGIPRNDDFNGSSQEGVGYFDTSTSAGRRVTSATAFLRGALPKNLTILTNFDVHRLCFEGDRVTGVTGYYRSSSRSAATLTAEQEVILSAGAFNSPKLLELSGIGAADRLRPLGIDVVADVPAVGENFQDHCHNYIYYGAKDCITYHDLAMTWRAPLTAFSYLFKRSGIFANPAALVGAFVRVDEGADRPDAQIHFSAGAGENQADGSLKSVRGVCASICKLRPDSRGAVHIRSAEFDALPAIQAGFLKEASDLDFQVRALKKLREIFSQPALQDMLGEEFPTTACYQSDEELRAGIPQFAESVHHPVGTCRMGVDDEAVVSPDLRVNGVSGLRVADASIFPKLISGNTHATCMAIGEKVAQSVLGHQ